MKGYQHRVSPNPSKQATGARSIRKNSPRPSSELGARGPDQTEHSADAEPKSGASGALGRGLSGPEENGAPALSSSATLALSKSGASGALGRGVFGPEENGAPTLSNSAAIGSGAAEADHGQKIGIPALSGAGQKPLAVDVHKAPTEHETPTTKAVAANSFASESVEMAHVSANTKTLGGHKGLIYGPVRRFLPVCSGGEPTEQRPECGQCVRFHQPEFPCPYL